MVVERFGDILRNEVRVTIEGRGVGWLLRDIISGGALSREARLLRRHVIDELVSANLDVFPHALVVEQSAWMQRYRKGSVRAFLSERGKELLSDAIRAVDTNVTQAMIIHPQMRRK